ncbi:endolytic transglycosylase MltG [Candidatus Saccharibacteria bacterium]|nr:endolytic transglycosylase MltG [Candidatus Saccharibacteria bacterium]
MKVIGLDVGEKRIGVAKADSNTRIAVPVGYVVVDGTEWQQISQIARLNNTNLFVVGLPRSNEGAETAQSIYVRDFVKKLTELIPGARVRLQDESLTSVVAEERLKQRKKRYERGDIDAEAASIILQDFLEGLGRGAKETSTEPDNDGPKPNRSEKSRKKHKMGGVAVTIIALLVAGLIAGGVTFGIVWFKNQRAKEREEYYRQLESEMEAKTFNFTIRPGETIYEIKKQLAEVDRNGGQTEGELLPKYTEAEIEAGFAANYDFSFLKERPEGATLEGYLYPETYNFYGNATVEDILKRFLSKMNEVISQNDLIAKYQAHNLSLFEGITLASVVQKEAPASEQATVAQVFLSRLSHGIPLGSDVTVSYALDTVDPSRSTYSDNAAALSVNSCYNTRLHGGLPCGPISNPGLSALLAVANPSDTSYLYFLTGDDGMMYYSYTESEHNQNIYSHCQELCNVSL